MKSELQLSNGAKLMYDSEAEFTTKEGKTFKFVSLRKIDKKGKWQAVTWPLTDKDEVKEWLKALGALA